MTRVRRVPVVHGIRPPNTAVHGSRRRNRHKPRVRYRYRKFVNGYWRRYALAHVHCNILQHVSRAVSKLLDQRP